MLSIGTFSRATHLSIRALRRYHEQGLLVPAGVDRVTGYRSYRHEQILDAQLIRRLRDLDLPLSAVRHVVDSRDDGLTQKVLAEHRLALSEHRADVDRKIADLSGLIERGFPLHIGPVHVRDQTSGPLMMIRARTPERDFLVFFARAFARLGAHVARHGLTVIGPGGARFPNPQWDGDDVEVEVFVPVTESVAAGSIEAARLPAGRLAVVLHAGGYDGIDDAHAALGGWFAVNGVEPAGSLQELYLVSPGDTADPAEWRTEVGWLMTGSPPGSNEVGS